MLFTMVLFMSSLNPQFVQDHYNKDTVSTEPLLLTLLIEFLINVV